MSTRLRRHLDPVRLWFVGGWIGVGLALLLSLLPPALQDTGGHADKLVHLLGYGVLMLWWAQLTRQRWKLALAVVLLGITIELLQGLTPNRQPDVLDVVANSSGVLLGWLAARLLDRSATGGSLPRYLATLPASRR